MKAHRLYVLGLAVAFVLGVAGAAFAADTPATPAPAAKPAAAPASTPTTPAAPAAKEAPKADAAKKPAEELTKVTVKGKVESKMVKNKKGEEVKAYGVIVAEAKGDDGKAIDKLKGKTLHITGLKGELDKFVGKDAEIKGETNGKRIKATSIK